jgi:hypothetical protein
MNMNASKNPPGPATDAAGQIFLAESSYEGLQGIALKQFCSPPSSGYQCSGCANGGFRPEAEINEFVSR